MKKPLNIVYGVEEAPPLGVTLGSGVQHIVLIAIRLLFPLLVAREAGLAPERILDVLGVSMLIMGLGPILQAITRGPFGSGYLCPTSFTSAYIAPSLVAAKTGGMALVVGMTLFGGVLEAALSRALRPLRPFFPPEIPGFVIVVVGVTLGSRYVLGVGTPAGLNRLDLMVTAVSLGAMIVLNVWTKGSLRVFCVLIGVVVGYVAAALAGILTVADLGPVQAAPVIHVPHLGHGGWSFDLGLAIPFGVAALAACLRTMGDITTCQKINDAEWTRPDLRSISGGVLANGLSTAMAGICGTIGVNTLTSSFDEFNLNLRVSHVGPTLGLPDERPSVVLVGQRRAEEGHDPVAHHLVHGAPVAVDGLHHALEHGVEDLARFLGIGVGQQLHRALEVGE